MLDLSEDADGDITCACPVYECHWTSWATSEQERVAKENHHAIQEHPEVAKSWARHGLAG